MGEPLGIGPELILRTLNREDLPSDVEVSIFGSRTWFTHIAHRMDIPLPWEQLDRSISFVEVSEELEKSTFSTTADRAQMVIASLDRGIQSCLDRHHDALVTAPLDKSVIRNLLPNFQGHTGYLQEKVGCSNTVMLMDNREIRVAMVTDHIPLLEVSSAVTQERLESTILTTAKHFQKHFGVEHPRIAVAALNPHAGEISDHPEENTVFFPVIEKLSKKGLRVEGPFPADTLFALARKGTWDVIISPYHDQGLVAVKYPGLEHVVNITLGLPFLRTSPGHGVAYDRVGNQNLELRSFQRALNIAITGRLNS